jgi:exonuclease SbcC
MGDDEDFVEIAADNSDRLDELFEALLALAMRSGTRLRTLFIDEGFGTQDQQGLEQLVEAIQIISRDFDKVLVVTHLEQLKAAFPVQIEVTKHPDLGSRFEIMQHG